MHAVGPRGEQHDLEFGVEQVEQRLDLFDDRVFTARVEERPPVAPRCLEVVLSSGRVGEDAVEVDDDGGTGHDRLVAPRPVIGKVLPRLQRDAVYSSSPGAPERYRALML